MAHHWPGFLWTTQWSDCWRLRNLLDAVGSPWRLFNRLVHENYLRAVEKKPVCASGVHRSFLRADYNWSEHAVQTVRTEKSEDTRKMSQTSADAAGSRQGCKRLDRGHFGGLESLCILRRPDDRGLDP